MDLSNDQIILIAALGLPALVLALLRINAAMVFLSLCLGAALVTYVAGEANSLISWISPSASQLSTSTIQLILLLGPAVVTCIVTLFSVRGGAKAWFNILPAVATAAFATLLVVPLLPYDFGGGIESLELWDQLERAQALIVGVGAIISLALLWFQRHGLRGKEKKKGKK